MCEPHFMPYDKLEEALLNTIKKTCKKYTEQINISELSKEIANKKKNTNQNKERITEFYRQKLVDFGVMRDLKDSCRTGDSTKYIKIKKDVSNG